MRSYLVFSDLDIRNLHSLIDAEARNYFVAFQLPWHYFEEALFMKDFAFELELFTINLKLHFHFIIDSILRN
jgi:hypothetical protein